MKFIYVIIPEIYLTISLIFLLLILAVISFSNTKIINSHRHYSVGANYALFVSTTFVIFTTALLYNSITFEYYSNSFNYMSDKSSALFKFTFLIFTLVLINIFLPQFYKKNNIISGELYLSVLFYLLFCLYAAISNNFISVYLMLEAATVCMYLFVAISRKTVITIEGIIKYFIVNSIATSYLLWGMSLTYFSLGTINLTEIASLHWNNNNFFNFFSILSILITIMLKFGSAPLHNWLIDFYKSTSYEILAFLLVNPKILLVMILLKFYKTYFDSFFSLSPIFIFFSCSTLFVGSILALYTTKLKDLVIYSSLANLSFFFLCFLSDCVDNYVYLFIFLFMYNLNTLATLCVLSSLREFSSGRAVDKITDLTGLYTNYPMIAIILTLQFLSLAGMPPFFGFFYKFYYLNMLINSNMIILFIFLMSLFIFSAFYYIRIIKLMFVNNTITAVSYRPLDSNLAAIFVSAIFILNIIHILIQDFVINLISTHFI